MDALAIAVKLGVGVEVPEERRARLVLARRRARGMQGRRRAASDAQDQRGFADHLLEVEGEHEGEGEGEGESVEDLQP